MRDRCLIALCAGYTDPHGEYKLVLTSIIYLALYPTEQVIYWLLKVLVPTNLLNRTNSEQFSEAFDFNIGKKLICVRLKGSGLPGP